jgi:arylsulfatase A-like enzyme/Flp pilus assembly protein TadD
MKPGTIAAGLAAGLLFFGIATPPPARAADKPNILLVTIDTLRADRLGCYSPASHLTPRIDGLAGRGALFGMAFAHTPTTLPSHTNILLGVTPNAHGVHDNGKFIVRGGFTTLAEWLKTQGYATAAFVGAFPLDSRFGLTRGFDVYDDAYGSQERGDPTLVERKADAVVDKALEWLSGRPGPWFAWVHFFDPHQPYAPPEPFRSRYPLNPYDGEVASVDAALGRLLDALGITGGNQNAAVILTADHGEALGEHGEETHGYFAYNATLHVPLIMALPGIKPARVDDNVCHTDIFPTICDFLGRKAPAALQGRSLLPLLRGRTLPARPIYFESLGPYYTRGWAPLRGFVMGREKYFDSPIPEFYDLRADFGELKNLADKADLQKCRKTLADLVGSQTSPLAEAAGRAVDRETAEKLRSLGYASGPARRRDKPFTAADDLKTLLPFHAKWQKATAAFYAGRQDEGISLLEEIVSERKDFDLAVTSLADFYKARNRLSDAEALLRRAASDNPGSTEILSSWAIALLDQRRFDEAVDVLMGCLAIVDFDPEIWNYLGVAYYNKHMYDEAQAAYAKALGLDANDAIVLNNLGSLSLSRYLETRSPALLTEAVEQFREATTLDPRRASAWNGLGASLRQSGDVDGAVAAWTKAVEIKPDFDFPLYNLGLILLTRGDKAGALSYFTRYKTLCYATLPAKDKAELDDLIRRCR